MIRNPENVFPHTTMTDPEVTTWRRKPYRVEMTRIQVYHSNTWHTIGYVDRLDATNTLHHLDMVLGEQENHHGS